MESLNLVFISDKCYYIPMLVTISSALDKTSGPITVNVILTFTPDSKDLKKLNSIRIKYPDSLIRIHDITLKKYENITAKNHVSKSAYIKLDLPNILKEKKILYLDSDLLVRADLRELWDSYSGETTIAAVRAPGYFQDNHVFGVSDTTQTFNSGVMLLNLDKMRAKKSSSKLFEFIEKRNHLTTLNDQAAFNNEFIHDWQHIDFRWNVYVSWFIRSPKWLNQSKSKILSIRNEAKIVHFNGKSKPWQWQGVHPYKKKYLSYYYDISEKVDIRNSFTLSTIIIKVKEFLRFLRGNFYLL